MRIIIDSTEEWARFRGIPCRLWRGSDGKGQAVMAGVLFVAVAADGDRSEYTDDLKFLTEAPAPVTRPLPAAHTIY